MSNPIRAGEFRICPYCASRNKAVHKYCVRCSAPMETARSGAPATGAVPAGNDRLKRFLVAAAVLGAIGIGLMWRTVSRATGEVAALSDEVRADSAGTVTAPVAPPPTVSGWYPGANVPVDPETAPAWSANSVPTTPATPTAQINPYDVPGDPGASMVGIAPSSPRARASVNPRRVYTEQDLLATRGAGSGAPPASADVAERESKLGVAQSRVEAARTRLQQARAQRSRSAGAGDDHVQEAIEQAADDLEDAEDDVAKARRKLAEERRRN